jgi:hypothetical protein
VKQYRKNILDGGDECVGMQGAWGIIERGSNIPGTQEMMEKG